MTGMLESRSRDQGLIQLDMLMRELDRALDRRSTGLHPGQARLPLALPEAQAATAVAGSVNVERP